METFRRFLKDPQKSFFLLGPRGTGKSTWTRSVFPEALWIDLLAPELFRLYSARPEHLRELIDGHPEKRVAVIDEIQKVPTLLNEVHDLIETEKIHFALCGSSARKVKRGHANLLGGRAMRYELFGLIARELGAEFDLNRLLNHGYIPSHYLSHQPERLLRSYVSDYLREEIAAEGLVRNLPGFSNFLDIASLSDAELVNFSTIARDCGVSSHTIKSYFEILEDTLMGRWLPAYRKRPKRRVIGAPKFYFSDVGVVNALSKRHSLERGSELFGKAFENWVFHELSAYNAYKEKFADLSYWRLASGIEVDFIVNDMRVALEAKATARITIDHLKGLRHLQQDHPKLSKSIVVCLEKKSFKTNDGIWVLPAHEFVNQLWSGEIF